MRVCVAFEFCVVRGWIVGVCEFAAVLTIARIVHTVELQRSCCVHGAGSA